jgi:DUF4097 and DUF4098 domain-containing protein YvlB
MISRRAFLLPALVLPFSAGCVGIQGDSSGWPTVRDEKRFSVEGKPEVELSTFDGSIEVRSWDRSDVVVVIEKRAISQQAAAAIDVETRQDGNHVSVRVKHKVMGWSLFGSGSARLIVSVPEKADVRASSGDGAIRLERVNGTIGLHSGDGRIEVVDSTGTLSVSTGDGAIALEHVQGAVEALTGDGHVKVAGRLTRVRARSGDGSVEIDAEAESLPDADWEITSGDGSITLRLPDGFNAELDARTGDGGIRLDGVNVTGSVVSRRNQISGRLGSGGHSVRLRTGDGSINLGRS